MFVFKWHISLFLSLLSPKPSRITQKNFLYTNDGVKFQFEDFIFLVRYKILLEKNFVNKSGEQHKYRKNSISYKIF